MSIEEKAKAYDEALERARKYMAKGYDVLMPEIFPELRESEDEKIRKVLLEYFNERNSYRDEDETFNGVPFSSIIDYLEKQKYDRMKPIYDARESFESALEKAWNDYHNGYENVDKLEDDYVECAHAKGFREGYLFGIEKQKDNKFVPRVLPCSAAWFEDGEEKQKEHSMSAEEVLTRAGLKPYKDGNQWCILAGDNIQEGICGFGDTIDEALYQFLMEVLEMQKKQSLRDFIDDFPYSDQKEPKFKIGDKLVSTKNPHLTYEILEVGHVNELGNIEYKVEIFTDGKSDNPRNIKYMECGKVDEWGKLIEQKPTWSEKDKLTIDCAIFWLKRRLLLEKAEDISTDSCPLSMRKTIDRLEYLSSPLNQEWNKVTINGEPIPAENHSVDIPLVEWNEEDERMLSRCIKSIEASKQFADSDTFKKAKDNEIDWLENRLKYLKNVFLIMVGNMKQIMQMIGVNHMKWDNRES